MRNFRHLVWAVSAIALAVVVPMSAHHAITSTYDPSKEMTVTGTLTELDWSSPHIFTYVEAKDPKTGKMLRYEFEGNPPGVLRRAGLKQSDWLIGQTVTATAAVAKDGTPTSGFLKMIKYHSDGHIMVFRVGGE